MIVFISVGPAVDNCVQDSIPAHMAANLRTGNLSGAADFAAGQSEGTAKVPTDLHVYKFRITYIFTLTQVKMLLS